MSNDRICDVIEAHAPVVKSAGNRVIAVGLAILTGTASAGAGAQNDSAAIDLKNQNQIVSTVLIADATAAACERDHPPLAPEVTAAFNSWQSRNIQYLVFAESDPRYPALRKQLLATKQSTPDGLVPEAECKDMIRALLEPGRDLGAPRAQQSK